MEKKRCEIFSKLSTVPKREGFHWLNKVLSKSRAYLCNQLSRFRFARDYLRWPLAFLRPKTVHPLDRNFRRVLFVLDYKRRRRWRKKKRSYKSSDRDNWSKFRSSSWKVKYLKIERRTKVTAGTNEELLRIINNENQLKLITIIV